MFVNTIKTSKLHSIVSLKGGALGFFPLNTAAISHFLHKIAILLRGPFHTACFQMVQSDYDMV